MNTDCRFHDDVNAFLADELQPAERLAFSAHLDKCPGCQASLDSSSRVMALLKTLPTTTVETDLSRAVLARVRASERKTDYRSTILKMAAWAAAVALIAGVWQLSQKTQPSAEVSKVFVNQRANHALDWLVQNQEADGSWNAERWGGQRNYAPALTALPLLALVSSSDQSTPDRLQILIRGAQYLRSQQNPDGSFGPLFHGTPYNSSISTLALLNVWRMVPDSIPKPVLNAAVTALAQSQSREGGWDDRHASFSNCPITQWHLQALECAVQLGWSEMTPSLNRGHAWLAKLNHLPKANRNPASISPSLLAQTGERTQNSIDFYQTYFEAIALKNQALPESDKLLAELHRDILSHQILEGPETGSWPPDDRWGRAGGRLYSTALAALALEH